MKADVPAGWEAELDLGFAARDGATVLAHNRHRGPLRVQKPLYPEGREVCQVHVLHPPSGVVGGDRLDIAADLQCGTRAQLTTPGAGKWYRSAGAEAVQRLRFRVADAACLEWLPQETIVFDGALARMESRIDLAGDARFVCWEILCLGRTASGERFQHGGIRVDTRITRDGKPLWLERGRLSGGGGALAAKPGWGGAPVCATMLAAGPWTAELLAACREANPADGGSVGVSGLPGLLVARYLGYSGEAARHWLADLWARIRPALLGREALAPRIWNT